MTHPSYSLPTTRYTPAEVRAQLVGARRLLDLSFAQGGMNTADMDIEYSHAPGLVQPRVHDAAFFDVEDLRAKDPLERVNDAVQSAAKEWEKLDTDYGDP